MTDRDSQPRALATDHGLTDRATQLHRANLNLHYASQHLRHANEELEAAQREHSLAVDVIEKLEAERG